MSWCRFFALVIRLTVALFRKDMLTAEGYVDDPIFTLPGGLKQRRRAKALIVHIWRTLNLDLSFRKGQSGHEVAWIGSRLFLGQSGIIAQLQGETVMELKAPINGMLQTNVVSHKALRTLAGKISNSAAAYGLEAVLARDLGRSFVRIRGAECHSVGPAVPPGVVVVRSFSQPV